MDAPSVGLYMVSDCKWPGNLAKIGDKKRRKKKSYSQQRPNLIENVRKIRISFIINHLICIFLQKFRHFYEKWQFLSLFFVGHEIEGDAPDVWAPQRPWIHPQTPICPYQLQANETNLSENRSLIRGAFNLYKLMTILPLEREHIVVVSFKSLLVSLSLS